MQTKRVLVVGGGSSGWTAAAYLNATLNTEGRKFADNQPGRVAGHSPHRRRRGHDSQHPQHPRGDRHRRDRLSQGRGRHVQAVHKVRELAERPGQRHRARSGPVTAHRPGPGRPNRPCAPWVLPSSVQPVQLRNRRCRPQVADERPLRALHQYGVRATRAVRDGACAEDARRTGRRGCRSTTPSTWMRRSSHTS